MLGAILGGVLTAMFGGRRRRVRNVVPNAPKPVPRPVEQARMQRQFDAWAKRAALAHDEPAVFLFTPKRRSDPDAKSDVGEALVALFDDATLAALRSIAVIPEGVRLGFQPLTGPDDVQLAVDAAIRAVEERLRARPRESAYR